jgi:hypothetical protein
LNYILKGFIWIDKKKELTTKSIGTILLRTWVALYGFVGAQMTWRLSPFIGDPKKPFALFRSSRDNFFVDLITTLKQAAGISQADSAGDFVGTIFCGGIIVVIALAVGLWLGSKQKQSSIKPSAQPIQHQESSSAAQKE